MIASEMWWDELNREIGFVSFRVRVVRASGRARRSGVGVYGASASNAGGPIANMCAGPGVPGGRLLRRRKGFKLFLTKLCCAQGF